jgi:lambda family phage tail tape measure protein
MATVGKDQLEIGADVSGVEAGVGKAKKSIASLGPAATTAGADAAKGFEKIGKGGDEASKKVDVSARNMIASIQRQIAVTEAGAKAGTDYYRVLASQRGIDGNLLKPYLDQLDAAIAKQKASDVALQRTGVSAAQTAAAMRGVPAQFTDIVTSIQGGQQPLTVLLQQGGQLKDMFGGIGPAAKALGSYVLGLVNPLTLAAAAVAVLGVAYYQASERSAEFAKSLIQSGNYVGQTSAQLDSLARSAGLVVKSQGLATDAVNELARSGKVTGDMLGTVATGVAAFAKITNESVSKAADTFTSLSDEPSKAAAKLNESLHFLDLATFQRIRTLEEQGQKEKAAGVAQEALATESIARMQQVGAQAGYLARALSFAGQQASAMWQNLASGVADIGKAPSLARLQEELQKARSGPLAGSPFEQQRATQLEQQIREASRKMLRDQDNADAQGRKKADDQAKIAADQRIAALLKSNRSQAQIRKDEREDLERDAKLTGLSAENLAAGLAAIDAKHKDPKGPAAKAVRDDAGEKMLLTLRQQGAALEEQLTSIGKLTDAEREQAKFAQLIADLKGKTQLTAEQKSLLASRDEIQSRLAINVALEREVGFQKILVDDAKRQADHLKATEAAAEGVRWQLADMALQQREQYDDRLSVVGLGSEAAEQQRSGEQIRRQYARTLRTFTEEAARNKTLESDAYKQGTENIRTALQQALAANDAYYKAVRGLQADWGLGASQALANYSADASNVFKGTEQAVTRAFGGMEDALVSFVTKGKADVKSLVTSILADIARITVRQGITGPLAAKLSELLGGGSSLDRLLASNNAFGTGGGGFNWGSLFSSAGSWLSGAFSFEGGGSTGPGPRSGGLDGRGGFMAVVHPNETVVDHTKAQNGMGGVTIVNNTQGRVDRVRMDTLPDGRQSLTLEQLEQVAASFDDPNSSISKRMGRNYKAERRR